MPNSLEFTVIEMRTLSYVMLFYGCQKAQCRGKRKLPFLKERTAKIPY